MMIKSRIKGHDDVYWAMDSAYEMKKRKEKLTRNGEVIDIPLSEKLKIESGSFYQFIDGMDIRYNPKVSETYYHNIADNFRIAVDKYRLRFQAYDREQEKWITYSEPGERRNYYDMKFHKIEELEGVPFSKSTLKLISLLNQFIEQRLEIQEKFDKYDRELLLNKQDKLFASYI